MDTLIKPEQLRDICQHTANAVTKKTAGIVLELGSGPPDQTDVCTVYTTFERGADFSLALTAEPSFFERLCRQIIRQEQVDEQDIEDTAIEYFNVLCGGIAVALYKATKTAARFQIPKFYHGAHRPNDRHEEWALNFQGDWQERSSLSCFAAPEDNQLERGGSDMAKRVMVVDDSRIMKVQLEVLLEDTEYEIVAYCRNGEEALACYDEVKPDLVTMDILMPGMDGLETAQAIMEQHPEARIIMLSSLAYDESFEEAEKIGAKVFVAKPYDQEKIVEAFEKALRNEA